MDSELKSGEANAAALVISLPRTIASEKSIAFAVIFLSALPAAAVFIDTGNEIPLLRSNDSILQNRISKNVCR